MTFQFYLGTHCMNHVEQTNQPLFISINRLYKRKKPFKNQPLICLDSGAFSQLHKHGKWTSTPQEYISHIKRIQHDLNLSFQWVAPQDWMCEPFMIKKTGLSVKEHIHRTVDNFLILRKLTQNTDIHIIPVLQGFDLDEYQYCFDLYSQHIDLTAEQTVGIGSVCRRESTNDIYKIIQHFYDLNLSIHGFGVKINGLKKYHHLLQSSDSMAWSFNARYNVEHCSIHTQNPTTKNCANCLQYALEWTQKIHTTTNTSLPSSNLHSAAQGGFDEE